MTANTTPSNATAATATATYIRRDEGAEGTEPSRFLNIRSKLGDEFDAGLADPIPTPAATMHYALASAVLPANVDIIPSRIAYFCLLLIHSLPDVSSRNLEM